MFQTPPSSARPPSRSNKSVSVEEDKENVGNTTTTAKPTKPSKKVDVLSERKQLSVKNGDSNVVVSPKQQSQLKKNENENEKAKNEENVKREVDIIASLTQVLKKGNYIC
jgi:hypothetical protein